MKTYDILKLKNDDKIPIFFSDFLKTISPTYKNSSSNEKKNEKKKGEKKRAYDYSNYTYYCSLP
jgi:hypothetical protein